MKRAERQMLAAVKVRNVAAMRAARELGAENVENLLAHIDVRNSVAGQLLLRWHHDTYAKNAYHYFMLGVHLPSWHHDTFGIPADVLQVITDHRTMNIGNLWRRRLTEDQRTRVRSAYTNRRRWSLKRDLHDRMLDIAIALRPLKLPVYNTLWILEWVQGVGPLTELARVRLLEAVNM
jgi:hypothetical protein